MMREGIENIVDSALVQIEAPADLGYAEQTLATLEGLENLNRAINRRNQTWNGLVFHRSYSLIS